MVIDGIDDTIGELGEGSKHFAEAKDIWARMRRLEAVEAIIEDASNSPNFEQALIDDEAGKEVAARAGFGNGLALSAERGWASAGNSCPDDGQATENPWLQPGRPSRRILREHACAATRGATCARWG